MWWKVFVLVLYIVFLFLISRTIDTFYYYNSGYLANKWVDQLSLNVRKLKILLDQRGVSYAGVLEKHELTSLVNTSG